MTIRFAFRHCWNTRRLNGFTLTRNPADVYMGQSSKFVPYFVRRSSSCTISAAEKSIVLEPTKDQLRLVVLQSTIPFIGFGIMDNALMIIAGDAIDSSLCVTFGFSTMCAAAIGNIISDLAGVGLGTIIEDFAEKLKLPVAVLTHSQRQLRSVRFANQFGNALGLTIGCIIGMFPLFFIDSKAIEKRKRTEAIEALCRDVVIEAKGLISADSTCLFLVVEEDVDLPWNMDKHLEPSPYLSKSKQDLLHDWNDDESEPKIRRKKDFVAKSVDSAVYSSSKISIPFGSGIVSIAAGLRKSILVQKGDPQMENIYTKGLTIQPEEISSVICVPVFSKEHKVIAVLEGINKRGADGFDRKDLKILQALAAHVSVALQTLCAVDEDDTRVRLKDMIQILKANARKEKQAHDTARIETQEESKG